MGLSASQARFLQLTARRSDIEYEAQQINFQRLQLSQKAGEASKAYQDKMNNRKMVLKYNDGTGLQKIDLSYQNYKSYMNQKTAGTTTDLKQYFLVSSSGNKLIVTSEEERKEMIDRYSNTLSYEEYQNIISAKEQVKLAGEDTSSLSNEIIEKAKFDISKYEINIGEDEEGNEITEYIQRKFNEDDFLIVDDLNDPENFQNAIQNGTYYFATLETDKETNESYFNTEGWDTLGGGAIGEEYDKSDDAAAQAEYDAIQNRIQSQDKKLELRLDQLESTRQAIQTEIESVEKVVSDNVEKSFNIFS